MNDESLIPRLVTIQGTHGLEDAWWKPGSDWGKLAEKHHVHFLSHDDPFKWSTALEGIVGKNRAWESGGDHLKRYLEFKGYNQPVNIVAHSHGGNVAAYALAEGLKCSTLITVATPVRRDMRDVWKRARRNIYLWVHVHAECLDYMQLLGSLFDGTFGFYRKMKLADMNLREPTRNHSNLLDATFWEERGWFNFLNRHTR